MLFSRAILVLLFATSGLAAHPLDIWHWRSPLPQGNPLNAVAYGNGVYVVVGEYGTILSSPDGTNWSPRVSGTLDHFSAVTFDNNQFVAVGAFGAIATSFDGELWTPQYGGTFFNLARVTYGNGLYVVVGQNNTILTSIDGTLWVSRSSGGSYITDIVFANGQFVAVAGYAVFTSPDGLNWFHREVQPALTTIGFGEGLFVAGGANPYGAGGIWTSQDGIDWQLRQTTTRDVREILYAAGRWTAAVGGYGYGPGTIYTSADAIIWTVAHTNMASISGTAFGAGRFIATLQDGTVLMSDDGNTWVNPLPPSLIPPYGWRDITYGGGQFIALDPETIAFSADGIVWTNAITVTNLDEYVRLYSIAYGNGLYVAGGDYRTLWVSSDAITWTNPAPELSLRPYSAEINDIIYANGLFIAVSGYQGSILTSSNGLEWSATNIATNDYDYLYLQSATFGNGTYVAVGKDRVAVSNDGFQWQTITLEGAYLTGVAFGNNRFVAVDSGSIWTSSDGTNWTSTGTFARNLHSAAFGNGYFVVSGAIDYFSTVEPPVWTSADGVNWTRRHPFHGRGLAALTFGNGTFVGVGGGTILQTDPLIALSLAMGPAPVLTLSGPVNRTYDLEYSDHAGAWHYLKSVFADSMPFSVSDPSAANSTRLYRAVLRP